MTQSQWEEIEALFHAALERDVGDRPTFVASRASSADVQTEVMKLLAAEDDATEALRKPFETTNADEALVGTVIGSYRLVRRVGAGGMGTVFLAQRDDGSFDREVALKVVKKGMDSEAVVERFQRERQILARLHHPNVAGLLDAGLTEDGRPFFVMEFVDGRPITTYCDERRLAIADRLALFRKACDAVHYAHTNLVVHRDIKPSNVLVTDAGEVKLLDFGIAKLLAEEDDELTQTGALLATPAYAAPEQLTFGRITTSTDVYALGALLYELLAGRRPFEVKRDPIEFRDLVLSETPLKPSTALTRLPADVTQPEREETLRALSVARGAQTHRLQSILRGDLDTICIKAIALEPEQRYASASAFSDDIERHLNGLPIAARGANLSYQLKKFYRRNRAGVLAAGAVVAAFALTVAFYTQRLAAERDVAVAEQAKTQEVVNFVTGLFQAADPANARGAEVTARQILETGRAQVESEMPAADGRRGAMLGVLGWVYYELSEPAKARPLLTESLAIHQSLYGQDHVETATSYLKLGMLDQVVGDMEAALESLKAAYEIRARLLPETHPDVIEALSALAFYEETIGDYAAAETYHQQALDLAGASGEAVIQAQQKAKLASLYRLQDRLPEAESLLREALEIQDRVYGGAHPVSDETKRQLAEVLGFLMRFEEAQALFLELIESRTKMVGPDHYETGSAWNSYGILLSNMGDNEGALDAYNRMLQITERAYGDTHPSLAAGYSNVALIRRNLGDLEGAVADYQRSIEMQDASGVPVDHPNRGYPLTGLARVRLVQREFQEAERLLEAAYAIRRPVLDTDHMLLLEMDSDLGAVLGELRRFDEAETLLTGAYRRIEARLGPKANVTELTAGRLVRLYELMGRDADAERWRPLAVAYEEDSMLRYY